MKTGLLFTISNKSQNNSATNISINDMYIWQLLGFGTAKGNFVPVEDEWICEMMNDGGLSDMDVEMKIANMLPLRNVKQVMARWEYL